MKRTTLVALALALLPGLAVAQNITRSIQGNSNDSRGPIGWDTSNAMYFPGHINAFGQLTKSPSPSLCGSGASVNTGSTDAVGSIVLNGNAVTGATSCTVNFGSPFNAAPVCVVAATSGSVAAGPAGSAPFVSTVTTAFTVSNVPSGAQVGWICLGNQ